MAVNVKYLRNIYNIILCGLAYDTYMHKNYTIVAYTYAPSREDAVVTVSVEARARFNNYHNGPFVCGDRGV